MIHDTKTCDCEQCHWADKQEQTKQRTFEDVINEWTEVCIAENRDASLESLAVILRLGTLGQRLIYEANNLGMRQVMATAREAQKPTSDDHFLAYELPASRETQR